jgi:ferredoxin
MPYDPAALGAYCGGPPAASELCRSQIGRFRAALGRGPLIVTCTQEAPAFREAQAAVADTGRLDFVNIRETAGWSDEAGEALPKIAALLARAIVQVGEPQAPTVTQQSAGVTLIYGRNELALDAAEQLREQLDITVLLTGSEATAPPLGCDFPVVHGTIRLARGHLGAFEVTVDRFAQASPSSRRVLEFAAPRDGAVSRCDLILDLSGGTPLFPAHGKRDGYLRADPRDPVAVQKALLAAAGLTGVFDKPRYVKPETALCAHARNGRTGCNRCLDACPTGAISPAGDVVAVDASVCAGCGACVAACPTNAMLWTAPDARDTAARLRALLTTYHDRGGTAPPVLLLHDPVAGGKLIEALARAGDGLPARVLPFGEPRILGLDALAAAFAYGAAEVRILVGGRAAGDREAWLREIALLDALLVGLGLGEGRVALIETDDPFALGAALRDVPARPGAPPARFLALGDKREITMQALNALQAAAPARVETVALPPGAPIGRVNVAEGCTLCLSCVSVCPTSALRDGQDRPALSFVEDACVQCGLCAATCPEKVITLEPRATFGPRRREPVLLREEAPALCVNCGKPFGVKSSIDRVAARLVGKHWMFSDPAVIARLHMCADCRVVAQTRHGMDPYAGAPRPRTRTADDPDGLG